MRFLTRAFAVIGVLAVLGCLVGVLAVTQFRHKSEPVPAKAILNLAIDGELAEKPGFDPLNFNRQLALGEMLKAVKEAKDDGRIKAIFLQLNNNLPLTQAQELAGAITDFRTSGKPVYAFADTYGEDDTGSAEYYLAATANKVWLQPMGELGLMGIASDQPFLKDFLSRNGAMFQTEKRKEYKTAFDTFTESGFTPANREMTQSLIDNLSQQLIGFIASSRQLDPAKVKAAMDTGPLSADEALQQKFIDEIGYRDEALSDLEDLADVDDTVSVRHYLGDLPAKPAAKTSDKFAVIYTVGELARQSSTNPLDDQQASDPREVWSAFRQAADDPDVKAIIFRVNSPGGSVVASETIRSGVLYAKDAGKPVIATMGEMAGSGGYWILANADKIIAEPATLTGSIGVIGGKPVVQQLLKEHGINTDLIATGPNAGMSSPFRPFTPSQVAKQNEMLDEIYANFKSVVAEGRNMSPAKVEQIARGRVWTAQQGKDIGLIDELGGFNTALAAARQAAGLAADAPLTLEEIPAQPTAGDFIKSLFFGNSDSDDDEVRLRLPFAARLQRLQAILRPLLGVMNGPAPLTMASPAIRP